MESNQERSIKAINQAKWSITSNQSKQINQINQINQTSHVSQINSNQIIPSVLWLKQIQRINEVNQIKSGALCQIKQARQSIFDLNDSDQTT